MSEESIQSVADGGFESFLSRRGFMRSSAVAGTGLMLTSKSAIAQNESPDRKLKVAMVGCGAQGERLRDAMSKMERKVDVVAICDIWDYNRGKMGRRLTSYTKLAPEEFVDFEEMLEKRTDLDAVLLPTPDAFHAPYTRMALEKGLAVYCEKMMSNTIEGAADMVRAQRETGGILQIGHQRRSNPRYLHLRNKLLKGEELFGRITHANAQWNRSIASAASGKSPEGKEPPVDRLKKYGYDSLEEFENWRMSSKFGGGIISDLGAHQIDLFNWFLDDTPSAVVASGGIDYFEDYELPDNAMVIYEFELPDGTTTRAYYQVLTTSGSQGAYEKFMGVNGTATISEVGVNTLYREPNDLSGNWEKLGAEGLIAKTIPTIYHKFWQQPKDRGILGMSEQFLDKPTDATASKPLDPWEIPVVLNLPPHTPHLENFFDAVAKNDPANLTCKVEDAYRTCVTVLKVYEALENDGKVKLTKEDFVVTGEGNAPPTPGSKPEEVAPTDPAPPVEPETPTTPEPPTTPPVGSGEPAVTPGTSGDNS